MTDERRKQNEGRAREILQQCRDDNAAYRVGLSKYHVAAIANLLDRIDHLEARAPTRYTCSSCQGDVPAEALRKL